MVIISDLALTEVASAIARYTREKRIPPSKSGRAMAEAARLAQSCNPADIAPPIHRRAERLLFTRGTIALRASDALHLALALEAGAMTMVTYDRRLGAAAAWQGMAVAPEI